MLLHSGDVTPLTPEEEETHFLLQYDLKYYCSETIVIQPKEGGEIAFKWNEAQDYLHYRAEKQRRERGWVRIIVVKGRQQGISTYITARFLHAAIYNTAITISILAHESKATSALFDKVDAMGKALPEPMQPHADIHNRTELVFNNKSKYLVSTAGSAESGRSQTAQRQHQSERAFFEQAEKVDAGVGQIIADYVKGTEVFKESTGNGRNHFYLEVIKYLETGMFEVVFIPWYWQSEYRSDQLPEGFQVTPEEEYLRETYGDYWCTETKTIKKRVWDDYQIQWRREKIISLGERKFKQEYPNYLQEAFQASGDQFFDSELVEKARRTKIERATGPMVLGVDPARKGDRTILTLRQGRKVHRIWKYKEMDSMKLSGIIQNIVNEFDVDKVFIDWARGDGTIDHLLKNGYDMVEGVNFNGGSSREECVNKRAEMAVNFRDWLQSGPVELPDDEDMATDIGMMPDWEATGSGKMKFPDKKVIKDKMGRSPDILDSIMLTFTYHVRPRTAQQPTRTENTRNGSQLSTLRRLRGNVDSIHRHRRRRAEAA